MNLKSLTRRSLLLFEADEVLKSIGLSPDKVAEILSGYLECALWTEEEHLKDDFKSGLDYDEEEYEDDPDEMSGEPVDKLIAMQNKMKRVSFETFWREDIEPNSQIQAYQDIKKFIELAGKDAIAEAIQENGFSQLGHDLWLTRNRHGAGFFNRTYEHEEQLISAAHALKEVDLYLTDNNTLAFSNAH